MAKSRLLISKSDIIAHFESLERRTFRRKDIAEVFSEQRSFWRLAQRETLDSFIDFLIRVSLLQKHVFDFPSRKETRYTWGTVPLFALFGSVKPKAYFSHYSAMFMHQLTEQLPRSVYLNEEQTPKPAPSNIITQDAVDRAFRNQPRTTKNITEYEDYHIILLNGKQTGQLGVVGTIGPDNAQVRVTDIERTLIDITVRPYYAGGVSQVQQAYRFAQGNVSINRLRAYLQQLNYRYPYHQAIGFYLEHSGVYSQSQINVMKRSSFEIDFYLCHNMKETEYVKEWKLHIPKGF